MFLSYEQGDMDKDPKTPTFEKCMEECSKGNAQLTSNIKTATTVRRHHFFIKGRYSAIEVAQWVASSVQTSLRVYPYQQSFCWASAVCFVYRRVSSMRVYSFLWFPVCLVLFVYRISDSFDVPIL